MDNCDVYWDDIYYDECQVAADDEGNMIPLDGIQIEGLD